MYLLAFASAFISQSFQPDEVPHSKGTLRIERLASLEFPWAMAWLPDQRLLITEKPGRVRIFANGELSEPLAGVPAVVYHDQGGLLDIEVDPSFSSNRWIYLSYTEAASQQPRNPADPWDPRIGPKPGSVDTTLKGLAVARARLEGNRLTDFKVVWRQTPKTIGRGHFGGRMQFDEAGKLWISSGDRQRFTPAQDLSGNLGKMIRIFPDGTVPQDNPFKNRGRGDVWSYGHRNPLGFAFHPATGRLWLHEMGPLGGDELNLVERGKNYGWPLVSNGDNYDRTRIPDHDTRTQLTKPTITWNPVISPSGMMFYKGDLFPGWKGHALIGGLSSMSLIRVSMNGSTAKEEERIGLFRRIRDVIEDRDGRLLVLVDAKQGGLLRLSPKPSK
jgi:glucose/arabinose dehydrogenase